MKARLILALFLLVVCGIIFSFKTHDQKGTATLVEDEMVNSQDNISRVPDSDVGQILFFRSLRQGSGDLYLMDELGENVRKIGQSGSRPDHYPNWSPDGQYITFESYRRGGWRIWIMKADGSEARKILDGRRGTSSYEFDPSFSSDGKRIFFASNGDIFSVKKDGSDLQQITKTPNVFEYCPYQSPDGQKMLFVSRGQIHVMNMDGSNRINLTKNEEIIDYAPVWSPDGQKILYYSTISGSFELHIMNADGSNKQFLLNKEEMKKQGFSKTAFVDAWDNNWGATEQYKASFSPNGQKIAFSRNVSGNREIFITNINGSGIKRLTNNKFHDGFPIWRPKAKN